ncbi:translational machinery component [Massarina eburnea CBS 473.64]|uniref:Translational machinery component n=1 Tax=Massarina eburnea CBS 473.64 TaxID=1395130 RepID=A0A6A6S0D8_9PLEO|nr:translational machinery component [Massarina eburnea CBS 473.64]
MLSDTIDNVIANNFQRASDPDYRNIVPDAKYKNIAEGEWAADNRHHLHIYAHKHNTHITLSRPDRNPLISLSCGNIGFKKAGRGTYDAAYQLAAFVMARIQDKGFLMQSDESIKEIELVYRGFGQGREAVTKAILGSEGKNIRPLIKKLSDSTRLKFGGTRSKKPRRLG